MPNASRDREVEAASYGSLIKSVNQVFNRLKTQISPLPSCTEGTDSKNGYRSDSFLLFISFFSVVLVFFWWLFTLSSVSAPCSLCLTCFVNVLDTEIANSSEGTIASLAESLRPQTKRVLFLKQKAVDTLRLVRNLWKAAPQSLFCNLCTWQSFHLSYTSPRWHRSSLQIYTHVRWLCQN